MIGDREQGGQGCYSPKTGRPYFGSQPSKKSIKRLVDAISMDTEGVSSQQAPSLPWAR
jgi:hypothetical protein